MNIKHFEGDVCKKCDGTLRYIFNKQCVPCFKAGVKKSTNTVKGKLCRKNICKRYSESDGGQKYLKNYYVENKPDLVKRFRKNHLKRKYNITPEQYDELAKLQNNLCAICKQFNKWAGKRLVVDHNHETNTVRALLCDRCNTCLGQLEESPIIIDSMLQYIDFYAMKQLKVA